MKIAGELASLIRGQENSSEKVKHSVFYKGKKNIKSGHALSYMHRNVFSQKIRKYIGYH